MGKLLLHSLLLLAPQEPAANADLVLRLTFDDGSAADSSGQNNSGKLVNGPAFAEGRHGKALKVDGKGGHVEIPNSPTLENVQEGDYTLAAWFKAHDAPPGKDSDNDAAYAILAKPGWHLTLKYNNEKQFIAEHWLSPAAGSEEPVWAGAGTWEESIDPGSWVHVVGVVDRKNGAARVYVNGGAKNTSEWEAGKAAREYGQAPWRVGIASPGSEQWAWPAKGLIDDVRIYRKALSEDEVQAVFKEGAK